MNFQFSLPSYSWIVYSHFPSRVETWNNRKFIAIKGNNIFRQPSGSRRRRPCLRFLIMVNCEFESTKTRLQCYRKSLLDIHAHAVLLTFRYE